MYSVRRLGIVAAAATLYASASAADMRWINPAGGSFSDETNWDIWSPARKTFDLEGQTYTVDIDYSSGRIYGGAAILSDDVTWNLGWDSYEVSAGGPYDNQDLIVSGSYYYDASLTVVEGQLTADYTVVGDINYGGGTSATLTIGKDATFISDRLQVGSYDTDGFFNVTRSDATVETGDTWIGYAGNGTANMNAGEWHADALNVGMFGNGTLNVVSDTYTGIDTRMIVEGNLIAGESHEGVGQIVVDATNNSSYLEIFGFAVLGMEGAGSLSVRNGGIAGAGWTMLGDRHDGSGILSVVGAGSFYDSGELWVGIEGTGSVAVTDGGTLGFSSMYLGADESVGQGSGEMVVNGWDATALGGEVVVGDGGDGRLTLSDHGSMLIAQMRVGGEAQGEVFVDGDKAKLEVDLLEIGYGTGSGALEVTTGGALQAHEVNLGAAAGSNGSLLVSGFVPFGHSASASIDELNIGTAGQGSVVVSDHAFMVAGNINVAGDEYGPGGSGSLRLESEAEVHVQSEIRIWDQGSVTVDGGWLRSELTTVKSGGRLTIASGFVGGDYGSGNVIVSDGGAMVINENGHVEAQVNVANGGALAVDGWLLGDVFLAGSMTGSGNIEGSIFNQNGGQFGAGNSPGEMSIDGDYHQDSLSQMIIEIAGYDMGVDIDLLTVEGIANLDGTLVVELLDNFLPKIGDSFQIITAGFEITSQFAQLVLPELGQGLEWLVVYNDDGDPGQFVAAALGAPGNPYNVTLKVQASVVPIPGAVWLLGSSLVFLGWFRRRRP